MIFKVMKVNGIISDERYMEDITNWDAWKETIFAATDNLLEIDKDDIMMNLKGANSQVIYIYILTRSRYEVLLMYVNVDPVQETTKYHVTMCGYNFGRSYYIDMLEPTGKRPLAFDEMCDYVEDGPSCPENHPLYNCTDFKKDNYIEIENNIKEIYKNNCILVFHQLIVDKSKVVDHLSRDNTYSVFCVLINLNKNKHICLNDILKK